jgi:hypothetical protein
MVDINLFDLREKLNQEKEIYNTQGCEILNNSSSEA